MIKSVEILDIVESLVESDQDITYTIEVPDVNTLALTKITYKGSVDTIKKKLSSDIQKALSVAEKKYSGIKYDNIQRKWKKAFWTFTNDYE